MSRLGWPLWGGALAVAALGGAFAVGPGAAGLVDANADGLRIWRLGVLEVQGVRGGWIGDLSAERATLSDDQGIWMDARDIRLSWSPVALFGGTVKVRTLSAGEIAIARRPALSREEPSRRTRLSMVAQTLRADRITVAESVFGQAAAVYLDMGFATRRERLDALRIEVSRLDAETDRIRIVAAPEYGVLGADIKVEGEPGGLLAAGLGLGAGIAVSGRISGAETAGEARLRAESAGSAILAAEVFWGGARWRATGQFAPPATPVFALFQRLGGAALVEASGALGSGPQAFSLQAQSPALALRLRGALGDGLSIAGPITMEARSESPSILAPEAGLPMRAAGFAGALTFREDGWALSGAGAFDGVVVGGMTADASGPVAVVSSSRSITFESQLAIAARGAALSGVSLVPDAFFAKGRLTRASGGVFLEAAHLSGSGFSVDARGDLHALTGTAKIDGLGALSPGAQGQLHAEWALTRQSGEAPWRVTLEATGERADFGGPLGDLLGDAPRLSAEVTLEAAGARVRRAVLLGENLRLGAQGLVSGRALDLRLEGSARGPFDLGDARLTGAGDFTGRVFGAPGNPSALLEAQAQSLEVAGAALTGARVQVALADGDYAASLEATYADQPLRIVGDIIPSGGALAARDIEASLGALTARGDVSVAPGRLTARLQTQGRLDGLFGLTGSVSGQVSLSGAPASPTIAADGALTGGAFGDALIERAAFSLNGPLARAALRVSGYGRLAAQTVRFVGDGAAQVRPDGLVVTLAGEGRLAGLTFQTLGPLTFSRNGQTQAFIGGLRFADGTTALTWHQTPQSVDLSISVRNAPVAPIAAAFGERGEGRLTGTARLRSAGGRLTGGAMLDAKGLKLRGRTSEPVDARGQLRLADETITGTITAQSAAGLSAQLGLTATVQTSVIPVRIAQAPGMTGRLTWAVNGSADALWALTGLLDQDLDGLVDGEGQASFGPGAISGQGAVRLTGGAFEDRLTGLRLRDVSGAIALADDVVRISELSARDANGGRLRGDGVVNGARSGRISLALEGLRFLDRPEMRATADGDLDLTWDREGSVLAGAMRVIEANLQGAPTNATAIPELSVREINTPDHFRAAARAGANPPRRGARLDLTISAPGRIFTRYRGASAEWAVDLRALGDVSAPQLFGEATLLRGDVPMAGRPFTLTAGRVNFRGPPEEAELAIMAERESPELIAHLVLGGTVAEPTWELTSDPALPEDEILPQVLFGTAQGDLSALQAAQLAASLSALAGGAAFDAADLTRRAIGLDTFDVRDEEGGFAVAGGRYLTRDVFLEVTRTALGQAETRVEWRVRPRLTLVTSFDETGSQRASVRWRRDY